MNTEIKNLNPIQQANSDCKKSNKIIPVSFQYIFHFLCRFIMINLKYKNIKKYLTINHFIYTYLQTEIKWQVLSPLLCKKPVFSTRSFLLLRVII